MIAPIDKVRGEGDCARVIDRGKEACECARKYRPDIAAGRVLASAARLRTETSYKAGMAIQQAVLQVLTPMFDPGFTESSHGFQPGLSAYGAAQHVPQPLSKIRTLSRVLSVTESLFVPPIAQPGMHAWSARPPQSCDPGLVVQHTPMGSHGEPSGRRSRTTPGVVVLVSRRHGDTEQMLTLTVHHPPRQCQCSSQASPWPL